MVNFFVRRYIIRKSILLDVIKFLSVLLFVIIILFFNCPFKFIFGIPCPMCGITRAFFYALSFDLNQAFHFHILWPIVLIYIVLHILLEFKIIKINKKIIYIFLIVFAIINAIYYFYRLINGIDPVQFCFENSVIYKIYLIIFK